MRLVPQGFHKRGSSTPLRAVQGVAIVLAIAALAACTPTQVAPPHATTLPVDPQVPTPTATAESSLSTTFALITDYGNCDEGEQQVAEMVRSWPVRMIATAGDNTQSVTDCAPYAQSVGAYYGSFLSGPDGPRFFPVPGNHDYENEGAGESAYLDYFPQLRAMNDDPRWYKVNSGNVNLFMLDSELSGADMGAQKAWLKSALERARSEEPAFWNMVVFHRPPFSSGPHDPNTEMRPAAGWDYKNWGADLVVSGHQHVWEELLVDGLPYVVAGVGASDIERECPAALVPESKGCTAGWGAVLVSGYTDRLTLEYRAPDGASGAVKAGLTVTR